MISEEMLEECLKQKLVLLTRISDITKQIEVQSSQDEIELGDLPDQRQVYIDRLKKCEQMICESYASLKGKEQERRKRILSGDFLKEECSVEEARLLNYSIECQNMLQKTLAMDREARKLLQKECDRLQTLLQTARNSKKRAYPKSH